jgi:F420-dependent oxidoreductase-like protein
MSLAIGFQVWASHTSWSDLMAAGRSIDERGFETLWSNDHFVPVVGPEPVTGPIDGPIFEGWSVLAGWAAVTTRARLGCLVSGAGYRNPALLVRMATALDHATQGRAVLGIGAGWHEREHRMYGFPFPNVGERLDRLDEAAAICRGLLDGQRVTLTGRWYAVSDVVNDPPTVQSKLPLVIGGSGERRTLRIVARYADWWNGDGDDPAAFARRNRILDEHCEAIGRDPLSIRRTVGQPPPMVRSSTSRARRDLAAVLVRHGMPAAVAPETITANPYAGPVSAVGDRLAAMAEAGASLVIFDWMAPFDPETLDALALLNEAPSTEEAVST